MSRICRSKKFRISWNLEVSEPGDLGIWKSGNLGIWILSKTVLCLFSVISGLRYVNNTCAQRVSYSVVPYMNLCSTGVVGVVRCPLDVPWTSLGRPLDVPWMSFGRPLNVLWMSLGCPLDFPWISFGLPLDVPWTSDVCPRASQHIALQNYQVFVVNVW